MFSFTTVDNFSSLCVSFLYALRCISIFADTRCEIVRVAEYSRSIFWKKEKKMEEQRGRKKSRVTNLSRSNFVENETRALVVSTGESIGRTPRRIKDTANPPMLFWHRR